MHTLYHDLAAINAKIEGRTRPAMSAAPAEHELFNADTRAINEEARAAGFIRLFDGRFKLSPKHVEKVRADEAARQDDIAVMASEPDNGDRFW